MPVGQDIYLGRYWKLPWTGMAGGAGDKEASWARRSQDLGRLPRAGWQPAVPGLGPNLFLGIAEEIEPTRNAAELKI